MKRQFYFQDDRSNKVWIIELSGSEYTTRFGRVGASLRETRKSFGSQDEARAECEKLITDKLRKGYVEGEPPAYQAPDWAAMAMTEEVFWRLIKLLDWKKTGDDDLVVAPVVKALSKMGVAEIERFEDLLAEKLYALDTEAHAREIGESAFTGHGEHFSVDFFLYVRCAVVANGEELFRDVAADPRKMPKDLEFEAILSIASEAYEVKTGQEFEHIPPVSYETFSNKAGWP